MPAETHEYLADRIGVAESLIRIGAIDPPGAPPEDDPAQVYVRYPGTYKIDQDAFKGPRPSIHGVTWVRDVASESMRKIWVGNMSHAFIAYRGWLRGYTLIHECATDKLVIAEGKQAVFEATAALTKDARITQTQIDEALRFLERRTVDNNYPDTVQRVGSDPRRKLGRHDRFIGPLLLARSHSLSFTALALGAACALRYDNPADPSAMWIQKQIAERGIKAAVFEVCELRPDETDAVDAIIAAHKKLKPALPI
jgi:mannitol-1-phosphate 5-dehydrogenase